MHRTIHDFLAAKQWVESGEFARQTTYDWNARTGYAACLIEDATEVLKKALAAPDGLPAATEMIGNSASFEKQGVADTLLTYFSAEDRVLQYERRSNLEVDRKYAPRIVGQLQSDFVRLANSRFLDFIVEYFCDRNSRVADLLVAYAATELYERRLKLSHQTYAKALATYQSEIFTFVVPGAKQAQLQFLNPVPQNRLKDYKAPEVTRVRPSSLPGHRHRPGQCPFQRGFFPSLAQNSRKVRCCRESSHRRYRCAFRR